MDFVTNKMMQEEFHCNRNSIHIPKHTLIKLHTSYNEIYTSGH